MDNVQHAPSSAQLTGEDSARAPIAGKLAAEPATDREQGKSRCPCGGRIRLVQLVPDEPDQSIAVCLLCGALYDYEVRLTHLLEAQPIGRAAALVAAG